MRRGTIVPADGDALRSARITLTLGQAASLALFLASGLVAAALAPVSGSAVLLGLVINVFGPRLRIRRRPGLR